MLSYLLRSTVRAIDPARITEHRYKNLPRELADALIPLVVSERSPLGFFRALCERFQVDAADTSDEGSRWAIEVWLPEGRVRWDHLLTRIDYQDLSVIVHENPHFLATFATSPAVDAELEAQCFDAYPDPVSPTSQTADMRSHGLPVHSHVTTWTALTPVSHGADGKSGNVTMFRRQRSIDRLTGRLAVVPFIAGNAVRGMLRDLLFARFLHFVGVSPDELPAITAHAFFSGGNIEAGANTAIVDVATARKVRELIPPWDLFAGCMDNRAHTGRVRIHDAVLVCRENAWLVWPHLAPTMPLDEYAATLPVASELTQLRLGTRMAHRDLGDADGQQMIFNTEVILPGAQFMHSLQITGGITQASPVTASCLADLLSHFAQVGVVGAQTSKLGLIEFEPYRPRGADPLPPPSLYLDFLAANREAIRAWLLKPADAAPPGAPPAAGSKRPKKVKAEDLLAQQKAAAETEDLRGQGVL